MPPKKKPAETAGPSEGDDKPNRGCCGCCRNKVAPEGPVKVEAAFWTQTKCHDTLFCLLFLAYWFGMFVVLAVAIGSDGSMEKAKSLLYGTDVFGYKCGANNEAISDSLAARDLTGMRYLHYPLEGQDAQALMGTTDPSDISLYGLCVNECPAIVGLSSLDFDCDCLTLPSGDVRRGPLGLNCPNYNESTRTMRFMQDGVVTVTTGFPAEGQAYETSVWTAHATQPKHDCVCEPKTAAASEQQCWKASYPTKSVMFRCIPCANPDSPTCEVDVETFTKCKGPGVQCDSAGNGTGAYEGWINCEINSDGMNSTVAPTTATTECPDPRDIKYVISTSEEVYAEDNVIGDAASGAFATFMGYANDLYISKYIIFGCGCGAAIVGAGFWVFLMKLCVKPLVWLTILGFLTATGGACVIGLFKSGMMQSADDAVNAAAGAYSEVAPEDEQWMWHTIWIVSGLAFLISFVMLCMKANKIRQATTVIQEASNALSDMPLMIFFPIFPFITAVVFFSYAMIGFAIIFTADTITLEDLEASLATAIESENINTTGSTLTPPEASGEDMIFWFSWYHLFGWLWANQLISAISMTSVAGAYSWWYFASRDEEKQSQNKFAFL